MNIAVVTDSTADISPELASRYDIYIVPAILVINDRVFEDGRGITREELYRQLPAMTKPPTTSSPSSGVFQSVYDEVFKKGYQEIISIHASSLLSSIYSTAVLASKSFGNRVHVVDSLHVTLGMGFQVLAAAEAIQAGQTVHEALKLVGEVRKRAHLVAMLDTLEYARRSGRVSWARSNISSLLQLKPFVGIKDGEAIRMGETRTRRKGIERLYRMLTDLEPLERLAVLHTNAEADALQMVEHFKSAVKELPLIVNVTSIIGVHVGPNGLGFVAITQK
jgi:fatty acid kinase fatty acid binding subunit